MNVEVRYSAQAREAAGVAVERVEVAEGASLRDVLADLARRHGAAMGKVLLDDGGAPHPSVLLFVNDEQVQWANPPELKDGDTLAIMSPISGG